MAQPPPLYLAAVEAERPPAAMAAEEGSVAGVAEVQ